jgi:hypothetical protein
MGDIDNAAPTVSEHIDDPEQMLYLFLGQGGCGFIKNNHLGIERHRLCDLYHLAL